MSSMRRTRRLKPITRAAIRQWEVDGRNPVDENFFVLCELLQLPTFPAYFLQQFVLYGRPVPPEIAEFVQANNAPREHAPSTLRKD